MTTRKQYTDEFKRDALNLLETSGKSKRQIESDLGITNGLLGKWQRRFRVEEKSGTLELSDLEQVRAQLRQAERERDLARMERDILKKTIAIFSTDRLT